ncbi:MAG: cell division protein ZapA [Oscillospiraceae bacterium]|nr:cell division protein ZapA [Oscillospiraceae bacterium]
MNTTNNVKVKIAGREFSLRTDDSPEYLIKIAQRTDFELKRIMRDNPGFGIQNASVITALTAFDEAEKLNITLENIRSQIQSYVQDAAKARSAKERLSQKKTELEAEIDRLTKENKALQKQVEELKKEQSPFAGEQLILNDTISPAITVLAEEVQSDVAAQSDTVSSVSLEKASPEEAAPREDDPSVEKTGAESSAAADTADEDESEEDLADIMDPAEDRGIPAKKRNGKKKKR